jgi:hypothetical protein
MSMRLNDSDWLRRQLGPDGFLGNDDAGAAGDDKDSPDATSDAGGDQQPDTGSAESAEAGADDAKAGKLDRKVVVRFGGLGAGAVVICLLFAMLFSGGGKKKAGDDSESRSAAVITTAAPTPVAADATGVDRPLTFTASANCPAGSTSAQTLDGTDPTNAFVCVRNLVDGQVIRVDLSRTYVITAISLTPGWVGKDSSGRSQWAQYRVVTRVQYALNDTDHTMIVQDTGNVHGEAVQPVKHVLASQITMVILQTSRPPAETPAPFLGPGHPPQSGGLFGSPGTSTTTPPPMAGMIGQTTDPVDAKFAISNLKIIGHEAI